MGPLGKLFRYSKAGSVGGGGTESGTLDLSAVSVTTTNGATSEYQATGSWEGGQAIKFTPPNGGYPAATTIDGQGYAGIATQTLSGSPTVLFVRYCMYFGSQFFNDQSATVTMDIASPCTITWPNHGFADNQAVYFRTTGTLPTGPGTTWPMYVRATNKTTNTFEVSQTAGGAAINSSGSQSGVHTGYSHHWGINAAMKAMFIRRFNGAQSTERVLHSIANTNYIWQTAVCNGVGCSFPTPYIELSNYQDDWVCFEIEADLVEGTKRLWVTTRDGTYNDTLMHTEALTDTADYWSDIDFIGFYNGPCDTTGHAGMHFKVSNVKHGASKFGPPSGFVV